MNFLEFNNFFKNKHLGIKKTYRNPKFSTKSIVRSALHLFHSHVDDNSPRIELFTDYNIFKCIKFITCYSLHFIIYNN